MSRALRRLDRSSWVGGCLQHAEFLLEQVLWRGEIEELARDAVEMFDVHLEVERIDVA